MCVCVCVCMCIRLLEECCWDHVTHQYLAYDRVIGD